MARSRVWEQLHKKLLDRLGQDDRIDWSRASLDSAVIPAPEGAKDRAEPDGSRQIGLQAPPRGRPKRYPTHSKALGGQRPRLKDARRGGGCGGTGARATGPPWKTTQAPEEASRRQRLRLPTLPRSLEEEGYHPAIARRGVESSERLGRHRWVVERTLSWLNRYRRLKVRYERRADVHQGLLELGCALICWNRA